MIRYFCDLCNTELGRLGQPTDRVGARIKRSLYDREHSRNIQVEVTVGVGGTWNKGHLCTDCVMRAVTEGTDIR